MSIAYAQEQDLPAADYISVVGATIMRDRRPIGNPKRVERMLRGSNLIVTARENGDIIGVLRAISDGEWVCYVSDLAVHDSHQRKGIGKALLDTCKAILGPGMVMVLVAYPEAEAFYRRLGMGESTAFYVDREISD
jgi:ribosomal protein S18 acetylase RimI-like enzyme